MNKLVISAFTEALGPDKVKFDARAVAEAAQATFHFDRRILGVIYPSTREEVQKSVMAARKAKVPLFSFGSGLNWGYGSKLPATHDCVLVNLKNMNRILEINESSAYAVIEPGVTYKQLFEELRLRTKNSLWLDATGSSMHASIVGNTLERGHGLTPYADHVARACNFEVVLGTGEMISTSFGAIPNNRLAHLDNYALGPALEGLFSQSNFGIVTRMTVWLLPQPEATSLGILKIDDHAHFRKAFETLSRLRLKGVLSSGPHFGNIYLSLARNTTALSLLKGDRFLDLQSALEAGRSYGHKLWNGLLTVYGFKEEVEAKKKIIQRELGSSDIQISWQDVNYEDLNSNPENDKFAFMNQVCGRLGGTGLYRANWRVAETLPKDLLAVNMDRERAGVVAVPASIPIDGKLAEEVADLAYRICAKFELEPQHAFFNTKERTCQTQVTIVFDKSDDDQNSRAIRCLQELENEYRKMGLLPHRCGVLSKNPLLEASVEYRETLSRLKRLMDPDGIISPGRYLP